MAEFKVKCTCTVCGRFDTVIIPAPVELKNVYENCWKRFLMRGWHKGSSNDVYYCPECGGR